MKVEIGCPQGKYDADMRIRCMASGTLCAHQYWCACVGRCKLTKNADNCPGRNEKEKQA